MSCFLSDSSPPTGFLKGVQQIFQHLVVRHLGFIEGHAVHQTGVGVGTDMRLHAEMPPFVVHVAVFDGVVSRL